MNRHLPVKLRTRLFLSISALMTVALLGLILGLTGVVQMANSQKELINQNYGTIKNGIQLRQAFTDQLVILLNEHPDFDALHEAQREFQDYLSVALEESRNDSRYNHYQAVAANYAKLLEVLDQPPQRRREILDDAAFAEAISSLQRSLIDVQQQSIDNVLVMEAHSRERALLVAGLLGIVGVAVLLIGFVTAHSFARRFSAPIEQLAHAADEIGQGNFQITLPIAPEAELSSFIRRFGLMAEALSLFKQTNVEALSSGQRRLQAVLDSIDDGLLIIDRQGRLEHANPVAQRQLGWTSEHIGQSLGAALDHAELDEAVQQVLNNQPLEKPLQDLEIQVDGDTRLLNWRLSTVGHDDGRVMGAVMVLRDVTEQRAFERVRNEFVLRASHELRTPVTGMHMAFALLRERLRFSPEARESELLRTVDEEMHRLVRLINDLLNFSRYQSGQQKLELSPCDVGELLERTRLRFAAQAAEHDINLQVELQSPLPRLLADHLQLERALDNLVGNALRHTPNGGQICLQARRHGDRLIISVEDTGEGIPYSQQARIFEPFVQIGTKKGGTGLGLALCKEIAQLHGGRLGVHSRLGQGTIFYLALPV
ncbi:ATP-binding protein [Pseudomonas indica]|uniref:histidine kinase n=1 Tax=Pseudomonas indica TaxID=137658 RepID=A0A1G9FXR8_9PSED|nr:ATP-binding protein [Pseudomonas indica]MBU3058678.1 PAS domain-containing protein [Pseudomonas indica]PAU56431.1 PAS domain-containing sensor histidine kinase [Pseudomonas indica]SDK93226.1 two-component system, NtrC family, sensor histidine kinase KinB [Pseudomonas indica]